VTGSVEVSVWITYNAKPKCALKNATAVYDPERDLCRLPCNNYWIFYGSGLRHLVTVT